jgi:periplasmic divalent cation tolerance protein
LRLARATLKLYSKLCCSRSKATIVSERRFQKPVKRTSGESPWEEPSSLTPKFERQQFREPQLRVCVAAGSHAKVGPKPIANWFEGGVRMANARIVLTTVASSEKAEQLAGVLVERRLAACVNIVGPIRSIYRWKDAIEREQEYLLVIKTTAERVAELAAAFAELHPYEVPEHVELAIEGGGEDYLQWLGAQVARDAN